MLAHALLLSRKLYVLLSILFYKTQFSSEMCVETSRMFPHSLAFLLFIYNSDCIKGWNHKKLKAGGGNNIIRDYFHSSAGFSLYTKATRTLKERERDTVLGLLIFPLGFCEPVLAFVVGSCLFTWIMFRWELVHTPASLSGFSVHEFLKNCSFFSGINFHFFFLCRVGKFNQKNFCWNKKPGTS